MNLQLIIREKDGRLLRATCHGRTPSPSDIYDLKLVETVDRGLKIELTWMVRDPSKDSYLKTPTLSDEVNFAETHSIAASSHGFRDKQVNLDHIEHKTQLKHPHSSLTACCDKYRCAYAARFLM